MKACLTRGQPMWKGAHCTQRHPPLCQASSTPDTGLAHLFLHEGRLCSLQRPRPPGTAGGEELGGRQTPPPRVYRPCWADVRVKGV